MNGLFGFWAREQEADANTGRPPAAEGLVWRVDLPADPDQASATLAQAEAGLGEIREALSTAERRFGRFVKTIPQRAGGGVRVTRGILPQPERTVLALLAEARAGELPAGQGGANQLSEGWRAAVDEYQAFIALVQASISTDSRVETRIEGQLIAQTRLYQLGDLETIWLEVTSETHRMIHQRSLQTALGGLRLMLEALAVNTRMASELSGLIDKAEGRLIALPLAWRFINEMWSEQQL